MHQLFGNCLYKISHTLEHILSFIETHTEFFKSIKETIEIHLTVLALADYIFVYNVIMSFQKTGISHTRVFAQTLKLTRIN